MKQCPFCKENIEENARFCLYCMKALNEKSAIAPIHKKAQWWPFVPAALLLFGLVAIILFLPKDQRNTPAPSAKQTTEQTEQSPVTGQQTIPTTEVTNPMQQPSTMTQSESTPTPTTVPAIAPTTNPTSVSTAPTTAPDVPSSTTAPQKPTESTTTPEETTAPEKTVAPEQSDVVYTYRTAQIGDDFYSNYQNTGNDIVITGVSKRATNGVYDIPAYIDGKKVIALMPNSFTGSGATVVYIPDTVKTIWSYAFAGCNLSDIYFWGNSIHVEIKAFSSGTTIHCSAECNDRNFRYYKNSASNYGATWEEWNG